MRREVQGDVWLMCTVSSLCVMFSQNSCKECVAFFLSFRDAERGGETALATTSTTTTAGSVVDDLLPVGTHSRALHLHATPSPPTSLRGRGAAWYPPG